MTSITKMHGTMNIKFLEIVGIRTQEALRFLLLYNSSAWKSYWKGKQFRLCTCKT